MPPDFRLWSNFSPLEFGAWRGFLSGDEGEVEFKESNLYLYT